MSGSGSLPGSALGVHQPQPVNIQSISNQSMPAGNLAKSLPYTAKLATADTDQLDLTLAQTQGKIDQIQSVYIDNADNPASISVIGSTGQRIVCPANTQGWFPVLSSNPPVFNFASDGGVNVVLFFCNMPMPSDTWSAISAASPLALNSLSKISPNVAASFLIASSNAARRYLAIGAPASAALWVNPFGGVASVSGVDCFQIIAGGTYESGSYAWAGEITGFTTATNAKVPAMEG